AEGRPDAKVRTDPRSMTVTRPDPGLPVPASATNTRSSAPTAMPRGLLRPLAATHTDGPAARAGVTVKARIVKALARAAPKGTRRGADMGHLLLFARATAGGLRGRSRSHHDMRGILSGLGQKRAVWGRWGGSWCSQAPKDGCACLARLPELAAELLVDEPGIRSPGHALHNLPHQEPVELLLSGSIFGDLRGELGQGAADFVGDQGEVAHLSQAT